ncbi:MAG: hypothetical protein EB127_07115 [Alphaproteobacteria bacterium]|nr:hypothetical protein [Alphaproteobacteria bacterium]
MPLLDELFTQIKNNSIATLEIRNKYIQTDELFIALASALKENTSIKILNIWANNISLNGMISLAGALKNNRSITTLNLSLNDIGPEGAKALAETFKVNKYIRSVGLWGNNIGPEGAKALAETLKVNKYITNLDIGGNNIGSEGARALAKILRENESIKSINLDCNNIDTSGAFDLAASLMYNNSLTALNLDTNNIGTGGAVLFSGGLFHNNSLAVLCLARNNIGTGGVVALSESLTLNKSIISINLDCNIISYGTIALAILTHNIRTIATRMGYIAGEEVGDTNTFQTNNNFHANHTEALQNLEASYLLSTRISGNREAFRDICKKYNSNKLERLEDIEVNILRSHYSLMHNHAQTFEWIYQEFITTDNLIETLNKFHKNICDILPKINPISMNIMSFVMGDKNIANALISLTIVNLKIQSIVDSELYLYKNISTREAEEFQISKLHQDEELSCPWAQEDLETEVIGCAQQDSQDT